MEDTVTLTIAEALGLARTALKHAGASPAVAESLATATVDAEMAGKPALGFSHLPDYLDGLDAGRIDGHAEPLITSPVPAIMKCDAMGGIAQYGFDTAFDELVAKARTFGLAIYASHNSYTTGELGWYTARLAEAGLVALAATNGPALLAGSGARKPVYCTNPLSFAAPRAGEDSPGAGLFILAIAPQFLSESFEARLAAQLDRLANDYGVHLPGTGRRDHRAAVESRGITLPRTLFDSISSFQLGRTGP